MSQSRRGWLELYLKGALLEVGIPKGDLVSATLDVQGIGQVVLMERGPSRYYHYGDQDTELFLEPTTDKDSKYWFKVMEGHVVIKVIESAENGDLSKAKFVYIIDNVKGPEFDEQVWDQEPQFKEGHWWYRIRVGTKKGIVLDGIQHDFHDETSGVHIESDHIAYTYRNGDQEYLWFDGEVKGPYQKVYHPRFGEGHWWYSAERGKRGFVVFDDHESDRYAEISGCGYRDGHSWVAGREGDKWRYEIDRVKGPCIENRPDWIASPRFSGNRYAYYGKVEGEDSVITNYGVFTPGGDIRKFELLEDRLVTIVNRDDSSWLYVEDTPIEEYTFESAWYKLMDGRLHYGGKVRRDMKL
jgi:hypothetical protein